MKAIYFVAVVVVLATIISTVFVTAQNTPTTKPKASPKAKSTSSAKPTPPIINTGPGGGLIAPNPQCAWSYSGNAGPYFWNSLCAAECAGKTQSPIDILPHFTTPNQGLGQIYTNYTDGASTIQYDGRNLLITPVAASGFGTLKQLPNLGYLQNPMKYVFRSAKIHATSEHTIYGMPFNVELHMVHTAVINNTVTSNVVICVFLNVGSNSSALLAPILKAISGYVNGSSTTTTTTTTSNTAPFTAVTPIQWNTSFPLLKENSAMARNASYFHYVGSLSTPPCTANASHFVFKEPLSMSRSQFDTLYKLLNDKNRPLQRQNQRAVYFYNARSGSANSIYAVPLWAQWVQWLLLF